MNQENIIKKWRSAKMYAQRRGFGQLADDFASYLSLRNLNGRGKKQTIAQTFIDFCREELSDFRKASERDFHIAEKVNSSEVDIPDIREKDFAEKLAYGQTLLGYLKSQERAMFILKHYYGFVDQELAICFGITLSRITQIMAEINTKLG